MTNPDNVGGLLPCPFCGGEAERIDFGVGSGDNEGGSCISCKKCQASGPVEFGYKENFVSNWNRRELCSASSGDAGGLPELPPSYGDHCVTDSVRTMREPGYTADQMRAYGELCRAAPAGGDVPVAEVISQQSPVFPTGRIYSIREIPNMKHLLERLGDGAKLYVRPKDSAPAGGDVVNEAFNLADTVIEHMQCGREQDARAAIRESLIAINQVNATAGSCDKLRPGAPCKSPTSCRENGCAAVERELFATAGSGEVEKLVRSARAIIDHAVHGEPVSLQDAHDKLTEAAAILRKLQQGAE